jgi:16S rRNA (guanine(966)-N(2))-methyltransferase RsmD
MIQIIGGRWKRRKLASPPGQTVRPTLGRAKQALFDLLGQRCDGQVVLDLFAGSGSVGLEALSRGASRVIFIEQARPSLQTLKRNIQALDAEKSCEVIAGDAHRLARDIAGHGPFDLIFADPPYGDSAQGARGKSSSRPQALDDKLRSLLRQVADHSPEAMIVLQADARSEAPSEPLLLRTRTLGDTAFHFLDVETLLSDKND